LLHVDAGQNSTTERILKLTGMIQQIGEVHEGESTTDFMEQEAEARYYHPVLCCKLFWKDQTALTLSTHLETLTSQLK